MSTVNTAAALHVAQLGLLPDPRGRTPAELLEAWPTLVDVAEAARQAGVRVSVVQACAHAGRLERGGVEYHFVPGAAHRGAALAAIAALLRTLDPDLLHVQGLGFGRELRALAAALPEVPIVAQDHASRPPRAWQRPVWRRGLAVAAGVAFCAAPQAEPFIAAGLLAPHTRVYAIPESTTRFAPGDRLAARRATGVHGDPALLWVGHLDANKDPLTILAGVGAAAHALPGLQLWCCFGLAPLLEAVRGRIGADAQLRSRVHLLGRVAHERVEQLMRAADLFVVGSHHEGSGYSLIEALACGLPPVVSDIPSFRALTGGGAVGRLWPCGDAPSLCAALASVAGERSSAARAAVRAHFERELSFAALGAKLAAMYREVVARASLAARRRAPLAMLS